LVNSSFYDFLKTCLNLILNNRFISKNYTSEAHGIESALIPKDDDDCLVGSNDHLRSYTVYSKYPNHVFDESKGWHSDPSLRVECFEVSRSEKCCPTLEVTSNSYAATFFPHLMGSYTLTDDYKVSGRRVYKQINNE
jgi:hypothetical protein